MPEKPVVLILDETTFLQCVQITTYTLFSSSQTHQVLAVVFIFPVLSHTNQLIVASTTIALWTFAALNAYCTYLSETVI